MNEATPASATMPSDSKSEPTDGVGGEGVSGPGYSPKRSGSKPRGTASTKASLTIRAAGRAIAAGALDEARRFAAELGALARDDGASPDSLGDASDRLERAAFWLARPAGR